MLKLNSKKGTQQMWWIITAAIIAILVLVFIIIWFKGSGDKAYGDLGDKVGGLGDCDNDNVADLFDKCPCFAGEENAEYDGCPNSITKENKDTALEYSTKVSDDACPCKKKK